MPQGQNQEEEVHEIEGVMFDIVEEISGVDFVDEATEPEQHTENDGPTCEDNENSGVHIWFHLLVNVGMKLCRHVLGEGTMQTL